MTKRKRGSPGGTIGSIIVGFDQAVFRTLPPAEELVVKSTPQRGESGEGDRDRYGDLEIVFPDDGPVADAAGGEMPDGS